MDGRLRLFGPAYACRPLGLGCRVGDGGASVDDGGSYWGSPSDKAAGTMSAVRERVGRPETVPWWEDGDVRHIARARRPFPRPGQVVRAYCGVRFRVRDGVLRGLPVDVCPLCAMARGGGPAPDA